MGVADNIPIRDGKVSFLLKCALCGKSAGENHRCEPEKVEQGKKEEEKDERAATE